MEKISGTSTEPPQ